MAGRNPDPPVFEFPAAKRDVHAEHINYSGLRSVLDHVKFYVGRALTVLPVEKGTKRCLVEGWPELQRKKLLQMITEEHNIAIRLDHLTVLDIDRAELWHFFFEQTPEEIAKRTWTQGTGRGFHVFFYGKFEPVSAPGFAELRSGRGQYVVVAPSLHPNGTRYRWISDITCTPIADLREDDYERLRRKIETLRNFGKLIDALAAIWDEGHRHNLALWLTGALRKAAVPLETAEEVVRAICLLGRDPEVKDRLRALHDSYTKPLDEIAGWSRLKSELESIVGPEKAKTILDLIPRGRDEVEESEGAEIAKPKEGHAKVFVPGVVLPDLIAEEIMTPEGPRFVVFNPVTGSIELREAIENGDKVYRPLDSPEIGRNVTLPSGIEEYGSDAELFNEIYEFLKRWHYSPHDWEKRLDALYVLMTWIHDVLPVVPYRKLTGPKGSGKSTWLTVMGAIAYRPLLVSGASSEASLLRLINRWRGTLLIDEADLRDGSLYSTLVKALNTGFDRKMGVITKCDKDDPDRVEVFNVFAPKLVTTREPFRDDALESRFITTRPFKQAFARFLGPTFEQEAERLRNKLLLWRLRNRPRLEEKVKALEDENLHERVFGQRGVDPRIAQILLPLWIITDDPKLREIIASLGELLTKAAESDEESFTREVLNTLTEIEPEGEEELMGERYLVFKLPQITQKLVDEGEGLEERQKIARRISTSLRSRGALIKRIKGVRYIYVPASLLTAAKAVA